MAMAHSLIQCIITSIFPVANPLKIQDSPDFSSFQQTGQRIVREMDGWDSMDPLARSVSIIVRYSKIRKIGNWMTIHKQPPSSLSFKTSAMNASERGNLTLV